MAFVLSSGYHSPSLGSPDFPSSKPSSAPWCSPSYKLPACNDYGRRITLSASKDRFQLPAYRSRQKKMHPGAYEMVDEETGEKVIVWGVDDDELPQTRPEDLKWKPRPEDLKWKPAKFALPGDLTEEAWYRILKATEEGDAPRYPDGSDEGMVAFFPEEENSTFPEEDSSPLFSKESSPKSETRNLASKGLFSKLKVQTLRSRTKSESQSATGSESSEDNIVPPKSEISNLASKGLFSKLKVQTLRSRTKSESRSTTGSESSEDNIVPRQKGPEASRAIPETENNGWPQRNSRKETSQKNLKTFKPIMSEDFFSIKSYKDIGANERIIQSLASLQVKRPSQIQAMSYRHVLQGKSCILADQTGSGKTLAYLAPLVQRFMVEEEKGSSRSLPKKPRALVMVPTSELAAQVLNVCRAISKGGTPLKSMVATGGFRLKTQVDGLEDSPDILIATPGRLLLLLSSGSLSLDNLISVILDEVDILFDDEEFAVVLQKIEDCVSIKTQYIHVTATLPVDVCDSLLGRHPDSIPLMGPGLHRTAAGLQEVLVDCSGDGEKTPETAFENKKNALLQLVEQQPVPKTIVFCNKIETCRKVENALKRLDRKGGKLSVLPYHAALSQEARLESMQQFINSESAKSSFLVCTDRASRGLDLADVEHVVLFDFPRDPSEYVRRVGRTARAGGGGKAFVFVVGKQVVLARKIMVRNEKGHPIHKVPSNSY